MWIVYLLSFIAGGFIAWLIDTIVEHIAEKEKYTDGECNHPLLSWRLSSCEYRGLCVLRL